MRLCHILALAAFLIGAAGPVTAAGTGLKSLTDRSDLLGWEAVGRLDFDGQGFCSAVLIAPDILMTAAHCLVDAATGARRDVEAMTFRAGWRDGDAVATRRLRHAIVPEAYLEAAEDDVEKVRHDIGLLRLANPIPASTAAPYRVAELPGTGGTVTVVSYGIGRSNAASRQSGCRVLATNGMLAAFDCNGVPGSSGAPVFAAGAHHPVVVSLISSGTTFEGREAVLGMDLTGVTSGLLADLRAGVGVWPTHLPDARRIVTGSRSAGGARFLKP